SSSPRRRRVSAMTKRMLLLITAVVAAVALSAAAASAAVKPEAGHYTGHDTKHHAVSFTVQGNQIVNLKIGTAEDNKAVHIGSDGFFPASLEDIHGNKLRVRGNFKSDTTATGHITWNPGTSHVDVSSFSVSKQ